MATYKVLQDIEAEDKLLGPLTLKQFGFAAITVVCGYISFLLISKGAWFVSPPFVLVAIVFALLAFPWGRDQPTEIWLLAKIRFFFKPRRRVWDQEGIEELVTITAPKINVDEVTLKDFDKEEAKSRLKALAETIDSRGWAVKNVNVNMYAQPIYGGTGVSTDRLIDGTSFDTPEPVVDIHASDDVLDEQSNPTAQKLDQLLNASTTQHRQELIEHMRTGGPPTDNPGSKNQDLDDSMIGLGTSETAFLNEKKQNHTETSHLRKIDPLGDQKPPTGDNGQATTNPVSPSGSTSVNPAILALADNDDLNVATIAREANKATGGDPTEVVVSLR